jgi:two-component system KDP operon response regulator KdpE
MKSPKALLLYEEETNCAFFRALLAEEGYEVDEAPLDIHTAAPVEGYCLVLFDIQRLTSRLLELVRGWRDTVSDTCVIVVGGRITQDSRIAVLETGVSAYFAKPVVVPELRARLRAALRRFRSHDARLRRFAWGDDAIDLEARLARVAGREVRLTPTECEILEHLAARVNQTVPCDDLVKMLWGSDPRKGAHSLRLFISKLRHKLESDPAHPRLLVTEPTIGYRLQVPATPPHSAVER